MTDKTRALLPVTQADRELYLALGIFHTCEDKAVLEWGWADQSTEMQAIARHRISHALPGDVGNAKQRAKQAAENWRVPDHRDPAKATAMVRPKDDCVYGFEQGYLAALTPSAPKAGFDREWCINMAKQEAGYDIGAGELAIGPFTPSPCPGGVVTVREALTRADYLIRSIQQTPGGQWLVVSDDDEKLVCETDAFVSKALATLPSHQGAEP